MLYYEGITTWGNGRFLPSPLPNEFGRADGETAVPNSWVEAMQEAQAGSHLFTLRVWQEEVGDGRFELRGALTHVLTGETGHFRDWAALVQLIESFVTSATQTQTPSDMEGTSYDNLSS